MQLKSIYLVAAAVLGSCAAGSARTDDPLSGLLAQRQALDGQEVQAHGVFRVKQGFANLHSRDGRQCVGLLTHTVAPGDMTSLDGRQVRVSGRLMAEGCPKGGACSEHLCGPAIIYNARVER
jgi:hypothetical protein